MLKIYELYWIKKVDIILKTNKKHDKQSIILTHSASVTHDFYSWLYVFAKKMSFKSHIKSVKSPDLKDGRLTFGLVQSKLKCF